jgi:hypothetical protein
MQKYLLFGAVGIVILGAGAYYGVAVYPNHQFRAGLDQALAKLPPGYTVTYGGARYSLSTRTAELTDVSIHGTGYDVKIGSLTVQNPALDFQDAWNRAAATPASLQPDQRLTVADRIEAHMLAVHNGSTNGTIGMVSVDKPRVYPWAILHPGAPQVFDFQPALNALMQTQTELQQKQREQPPSPDELAEIQQKQLAAFAPLIRIEAALLLASGYDTAAIDGLAFTSQQPAAGAAQAVNVSVRLSKAETKDFDRGEGGDTVMDGLVETVGPGLSVSVEHASQAGMSVRAPLMRVIAGGPLTMAVLDGASLKRMQFDEMTTTGPKGAPVKLHSFYVSDLAFDHGSIESAGFGMTGLTLSAASMPESQSRALFRQLGLETLTVNLGANYRWDADKREATVRDAALKVDELGALTVSADLGNVDPGAAAAAQPTFANGSIRYVDASLIDRLLSGGKQTPLQAAAARQQFAAGLVQQIAQLGLGPKVDASAKAIADFAAKPQSLTITLAPPTPIPLTDLQAIGQGGLPNLITMLGLSVTANQ